MSEPIVINFEGIDVKPKNGVYHCPYRCGDPNYPRKTWKTEKGFRKHMENCPKSPSSGKRKAEAEKLRKAESDAKAGEAMTDCPLKIGDTIFYVREIITRPTHRDNGRRMVRVRYEAEKRFEPSLAKIKSVGFDYALYFNDGIRISDVLDSMTAAQEAAKKKQTEYDEACKFASRCR